MKKLVKTALIVSLAFILAGVLIFTGAMWSVGFDFSKIDYKAYNSYDIKTTVYDVDQEFSDVLIKELSLDISFETTTEDTASVRVVAAEGIEFEVYVENDMLNIKRTADAMKMNLNGFHVSVETPEITVYLPQKAYDNLSIDSTSGNALVNELTGVSFKNAEITSTSGEVSVHGSVTDSLIVNTTSGNIDVGFSAIKDVKLDSTSGEIYVQKLTDADVVDAHTTSGDMYFSLSSSKKLYGKTTSGDQFFSDTLVGERFELYSNSGEITLSGCDSDNMILETISGDIYGELLSQKRFVAETTSGDIDIDYGAHGENGLCQVTTTSGDITFMVNDNKERVVY